MQNDSAGRWRSIHPWILAHIIVFLAAPFYLTTSIAAAESIKDDGIENDVNDEPSGGNAIVDCGVYLAPSSIPGSGLGMYLGNRTLEKEQRVTEGDVVIPIVERPWHNGKRFEDEYFLWNEYTWGSGEFFELTKDEIGEKLVGDMSMASPGVGAAANCYLSMVNVEEGWSKMDRAEVPPESPGQGAFATIHDRYFYATDEMEPGQEIFVSYGSDYFESRDWAYGFIPLNEDFDHANKILLSAREITLDNEDLPADVANETWNDLHSLLKYIGDNSYEKTSRILNAIPTDVSTIENILDDGGTAWQDHNRSVKDLQWLEEHGQCMDNISPGTSSIPDAGRGAFATRFIPTGGLVSPTPLIHLGDLNILAMFMEHVYNEEDRLVPNQGGVYTWQLLLNYCFGHERSTLLLCPYGLLSSLINHSPGDGANTKIQWSEKHRMRHPEWMDQPIDEWAEEYHTGLQMDFVATRDIQQGDEILIDYGDAWRVAWEKHADQFRFEDHRTEYYRPSYELNDDVCDEAAFGPIRTEGDRDYRLDEVQLHCRGWYLARRGLLWSDEIGENPMCTIVKQLGDDSYLVRIIEWYDNDDERMSEYFSYDGLTAWGIPRDAFFFEDLPYTRDIHQEWVFRHPMMIPDEIFPEDWKNVDEDDHSFLQYKEEN